MNTFCRLLLFLLLMPATVFGQTGLDTLSLRSIFYEPELSGDRPDFTSFSPDLSRLYYQKEDTTGSEERFFQVDLKGKKIAPAAAEYEPGFTLAPDGQKLVYTKNGDIWIADTHFSDKRRLIHSDPLEYDPTWAPDSRRLAYIRKGDVWILNIETSQLTQVTDKKDGEPGYDIIDWAGDDKLVLQQQDRSDYKEYYFPEYTGQYVETGATRRGVAKQLISVAYLDSGKIRLMFEKKGYLNTDVSASGRYLAIDYQDAPMKHRTITVTDLEQPKTTVVFEDSTKGWIYGADIAFAPRGETLMFLSEKDGWNHIYTVDPDGNNLHQHTDGRYEVPWVKWTGQNSLVFASTKVDPGERHIYRLDIDSDSIKKLTTKTGFRQDFELSRDHSHLVYLYSYFNQPSELYTLNLKNPGKEIRLTHTVPERFKKIEWQKEDYIRFTGRDDQTRISMSVLEPLEKQPGEKYPVVVFVHGAGSLQNVYKGWSTHYYREYMFHQFLNTHGFYVVEIDYRHSTGYGRKFREDVTNWMGKYETRDIVDGIDYVAKHYSQADTSQVGIYGGSYGGFMALYATSVKPSYFDAAAALRAVTNWENYYYTNPWYTMPRLGKPDADSVHYARSSPVSYVEDLEKPVLVLHGLIDNNVGFQDAAQYIDRLIQAGNKDFEMMMYPSERHSFKDPDAWFDEYSRIFSFFNQHLKPQTAKSVVVGK